MKGSVTLPLLPAFLVKILVASSEAAIEDIWASDEIFPSTYSDFDTFSIPDDEFQGSIWDENLITDADPFTEFFAGADTGCFEQLDPSSKRRRQAFCAPTQDPPLALPHTPFDTLEQKNRINLDLDPIRFPGGFPQLTRMDNIYCGNQQFVVCDSARENDKKPNGNGKYRLQNVRRGMYFDFFFVISDQRILLPWIFNSLSLCAVLQGSLCISPHSIWCCDNYFPGWVSLSVKTPKCSYVGSILQFYLSARRRVSRYGRRSASTRRIERRWCLARFGSIGYHHR